MTSFQQLSRISLVQGAGDDQCNVVDHVAIGEILHEFGQRACCLALKIAEFCDKLVGSFVGKGRGRWIGREGGEKVAIGGGKLEFDICSCMSAE